MSAALPILAHAEVEKIAAIAARIQSDHDAEALTAARMLTRALDRHGMRIGDVIITALQPKPVYRPRRGVAQHTVRAAGCLMRPHLYSPKELKFLRDLRSFRSLSEKQENWLDALVARWDDGGEF